MLSENNYILSKNFTANWAEILQRFEQTELKLSSHVNKLKIIFTHNNSPTQSTLLHVIFSFILGYLTAYTKFN